MVIKLELTKVSIRSLGFPTLSVSTLNTVITIVIFSSRFFS